MSIAAAGFEVLFQKFKTKIKILYKHFRDATLMNSIAWEHMGALAIAQNKL